MIGVGHELEHGDASILALSRDLADGPFFGHNRNNDVDQGFRDAFWLQSMACGHRAAYECIAAFSETDFRDDLAKFDVPTLVIHGEHDDTVPLASVLDWARPQTLPVTVVPGGGHFFHGQLPLLKSLVLRHLRS